MYNVYNIYNYLHRCIKILGHTIHLRYLEAISSYRLLIEISH